MNVGQVSTFLLTSDKTCLTMFKNNEFGVLYLLLLLILSHFKLSTGNYLQSQIQNQLPNLHMQMSTFFSLKN